MSGTAELLSNYSRIRARLRYPPNAVPDEGINLRRNRIPEGFTLKPIPVVLDEVKPSCEVSIIQIPKPPIEPVLPRRVTIRVVERAICKHFRLSPDRLHSHHRGKAMVYPRHIFWYLCCMHTGLSFPRIAQRSTPYLRGRPERDHTTVLHAKRKIIEMLLVDESTANIVKLLEFVIFGGYHDRDPKSDTPLAAVPELHLAEKQPDQERGVPGPTLYAVDGAITVDSQDSKTAENTGGIQRNDHPDATEQSPDRHRQPRESAAGSSSESSIDRERLPVPALDSILWGG